MVVCEGHRTVLIVPQHRPHPLVHHQRKVIVLHALPQLVPQPEIEHCRRLTAAIEPARHKVPIRVVKFGDGEERVGLLDVVICVVACVALCVVEAECLEANVCAKPAQPLDDVGLHSRVGVVDIRGIACILPRIQRPTRAIVRAGLQVLLRMALPIVGDNRPLAPVGALKVRPARRILANPHGGPVVEHHVDHRHDASLARRADGRLEQRAVAEHVPPPGQVPLRIGGL
mmetsp:Transcript_43320/g.105996  ORF Transcript_43320/g.105996 Transcript_43320/m.105996 type:complete len:229 (+) Transcript_43320:308-994(+)